MAEHGSCACDDRKYFENLHHLHLLIRRKNIFVVVLKVLHGTAWQCACCDRNIFADFSFLTSFQLSVCYQMKKQGLVKKHLAFKCLLQLFFK